MPGCRNDEESHIVLRAKHNFILLNLYPYTSGHLMIAPYRHIATLEEAAPEAASELMALAQRAEGVLRQVYRPQGINLGMNIGECAGAGVADHIHLHMLPRWIGDSNFMTVVGETRVAVEDIATTWKRLSAAFARY
jgi:ATP adenylyltransferase